MEKSHLQSEGGRIPSSPTAASAAWNRGVSETSPGSPRPDVAAPKPHALIHGLAGAIACELSMLLLYPLDQVRTIMQVEVGSDQASQPRLGGMFWTMRSVIAEEGTWGLYKGCLGCLETLGISYFIYFFLYNAFKDLLSKFGGRKVAAGMGNTLKDVCASSVAGVLNVVLTSPLWVASMQLKFSGGPAGSTRRSLWQQILHIARTDGISALWNGTSASLALVANPIIQFTIYDSLKRARMKGSSSPLRSSDAFLIGALSKAIATVSTYPLQVAQTLQRTGQHVALEHQDPSCHRDLGTIHCLSVIYQKSGLLGLFAGFEAKCAQTILNAALMFMFYERIADILFLVARRVAKLRMKTAKLS